jgi:hypothetical protein
VEDFDFWLEFSAGLHVSDLDEAIQVETKNTDSVEPCPECGATVTETMKFCTECGNRFVQQVQADSEPGQLNELANLLQAELAKILPFRGTLTYSINYEGNYSTLFIVKNDQKDSFTNCLIPAATIDELSEDGDQSADQLRKLGWEKRASGFWELRHERDVETQSQVLGHHLAQTFLTATHLDPDSWAKSLKSVDIEYSSDKDKLESGKPEKEGKGCWLGLLQLVLLGWFLGHHIFHLF